MLSTSNTSDGNTHRLKVKGCKKIFHENGNKMKQKYEITVLIADKIDFKAKAIASEKEEPINFTALYLLEETQNTKLKRHIYLYGSNLNIYE